MANQGGDQASTRKKMEDKKKEEESVSTNNDNNATDLTVSTETEYKSIACDKSPSSFLSIASLKAPAYEPDSSDTVAGMDIVAVIDRSGSMAGAKLDAVKQTMRMAAQVLRPQDRLAIVTYDGKVERPLKLTSMTESGKKKAMKVVNSITERGLTNLSGGMLEGLSVLSERRGKGNDVSSVLLLTDGHANQGIVAHDEMIEACKSKLSSMKGSTSIYTFGYGNDHASELLDGIARAASGQYYFVSGVDSIAAAFGDALGGLMTCVAQNIRMEIVAKGEGVEINNIKTSFKSTKSEDGKLYTINIGDMMSEETRDILIDLKVPAYDFQKSISPPQSLYDVRVTYWSVPERKDMVGSCEAVLPRTAKNTANGPTSDVVEEQKARIEISHVVDQARAMADEGNFARASEGIKNVYKKVKGKSWARQYIEDLEEVERVVSDSGKYLQGGTHLLRGKARKHQVQRSNECRNDISASSMAYTSVTKRAVKAKFTF